MPPGTWWLKTSIDSSVVMPRLRPSCARTSSQYSAISKSRSRSRPVSYGRLLERGDDHLDRRLAVAEGERDDGGVDDVGAGLGGLQVVHRGHAADVVAVHVDRQADLVLERPHHLLGAERREHARHVLDADGVGAELLELLRVLEVGVERVHRADGVADRALEVAAALLDRLAPTTSTLRMSLSASKTRKTSMPLRLRRVRRTARRSRRCSGGSRRGSGRAAASAAASCGQCCLMMRRRSHGFSSRKRRHESNVAPPQTSSDQ